MSSLRQGRRPVADISYKDRAKQTSYINNIGIGDLVISEIMSDGFVSKTLVEPHLSFAIHVSGRGTVNEKSKTTQWAASRQIYSVSYARPMLNDFDGFHGLFIRPSFDGLMKAIEDHNPDMASAPELLRESWATVYAGHYDGVNFYDQLQALLFIVKEADGDEAFLSRIGLDDVFNGVLGGLVVAAAGYAQDGQRPVHVARSAKAVDVICEHIRQNIGTPLTIHKMEQLSGLTGRALNYGFQERFNCSPQEWQRGFLLDEARSRMTNGGMLRSMKRLSHELGFSSASSFAAHYKRRFGELPSETASFQVTSQALNKLERAR